MSSYGFPTMLQYSRLTSSIADIKTKAESARTEMVTGRIADLKSELGASIGDAHLLRKAIDDIRAMQGSAIRALGRAQSAQVAMTRASDGVVTLGANLLNAVGRDDQSSISVTAEQAELQLEAAISAFNTRYEGRNLFSGDAVNQPSLADAETLLTDIRAIFAGAADNAQLQADLDTYFNDPAGGFATTIYTGGAGDAARTEISDGELINYSAKADEQPVRDLMRSLSALVVANESTTFSERNEALSAAGGGMIQAANDLIDIRARVGAAEERIVAADKRLEAEATAFSATYNERTARDPFEAASRLQALESQLQASYVVTSRISQLTLANFLR
ncbi:MAG: flagellin [Pseudomonadota bacterium]